MTKARCYFPKVFTLQQLKKHLKKCPVCGAPTEIKDDKMGTFHVCCKKCVLHVEMDYE